MFILLHFSFSEQYVLSLYNETWVKKAHLHTQSDSFQGRPLDKSERDKV